MPIYEYRCHSCGHQMEAFQKVSAEPLRECPECGLPELRKMVSAVAFRLKGSGWYETDFKTKNRHNLFGTAGADSKRGNAASHGGDGAASGAKSSDSSTTSGSGKEPASGSARQSKASAD